MLINLRDLFPEYTLDCVIEVPAHDADAFIAAMTKEIADVYVLFRRNEVAYLRKLFREDAHYSLDLGDGIEMDAVHPTPTPELEYERRLEQEHILTAIKRLPEAQARRIYAYFFLGLGKSEIARLERVHKSCVTRSIKKGLEALKKYFEEISF